MTALNVISLDSVLKNLHKYFTTKDTKEYACINKACRAAGKKNNRVNVNLFLGKSDNLITQLEYGNELSSEFYNSLPYNDLIKILQMQLKLHIIPHHYFHLQQRKKNTPVFRIKKKPLMGRMFDEAKFSQILNDVYAQPTNTSLQSDDNPKTFVETFNAYRELIQQHNFSRIVSRINQLSNVSGHFEFHKYKQVVIYESYDNIKRSMYIIYDSKGNLLNYDNEFYFRFLHKYHILSYMMLEFNYFKQQTYYYRNRINSDIEQNISYTLNIPKLTTFEQFTNALDQDIINTNNGSDIDNILSNQKKCIEMTFGLDHTEPFDNFWSIFVYLSRLDRYNNTFSLFKFITPLVELSKSLTQIYITRDLFIDIIYEFYLSNIQMPNLTHLILDRPDREDVDSLLNGGYYYQPITDIDTCFPKFFPKLIITQVKKKETVQHRWNEVGISTMLLKILSQLTGQLTLSHTIEISQVVPHLSFTNLKILVIEFTKIRYYNLTPCDIERDMKHVFESLSFPQLRSFRTNELDITRLTESNAPKLQEIHYTCSSSSRYLFEIMQYYRQKNFIRLNLQVFTFIIQCQDQEQDQDQNYYELSHNYNNIVFIQRSEQNYFPTPYIKVQNNNKKNHTRLYDVISSCYPNMNSLRMRVENIK